MTVQLFVYGSLKRGCMHADWMSGTRFVRITSTAPGYSLVLFERYPALVHGPSASGPSREVVWGEVFEVDDETLQALDAFEECPVLYQRQRIQLAGGASAHAYVMSRSKTAHCPEVPGGVWTEG